MDYKKYSLENLETWLYDAMSCSEATPQEIYDVILKVVKDEYYTYKQKASESYELLALLNGSNIPDFVKEKVEETGEVWDKEDKILSCDKDEQSDFWEENYYPEEVKDDGMRPWGHSDLEYMIANPTLTEDRISNFPGEQYTEEELNAMCDRTASDDEKEKCREYNLREAEYYDKRAEIDSKAAKNWKPVSVKGPPVYVSEDGDVFVHDYSNTKEDKVVKWQLPVQVDGLSGDCFVEFPDDLLEAANLKEGDAVEWIGSGDGSYILRKVNVHS